MNFVSFNATGLPPLALGNSGQCLELLDVSALRQSFPEVIALFCEKMCITMGAYYLF